MEGGSGTELHAPDRPARPPKPGRNFLRQRPVQQQQAQSAREVQPPASWEQRQKHVVHAFSGLGPVASKLSLVLAQPEIDCEELRSMGFFTVKTSAQLTEPVAVTGEYPSNVTAIVIVNYRADFQVALDCCSAVDQSGPGPASIAVLIWPGDEPAECAEQDLGIVRTFLETGADDVITVYGSETISGLRVQEAILRTMIMARKASAMISHEVDSVKKKAAKTLQVSWDRFKWDLPGKVLENIPFKDDNVQEHSEQNAGIGEYVFTGQLGAGTFGAVFKAEHPRLGTCALKVIAKSSVKNVWQLLSIDSELCIMTNLSPHPHVARAHAALHNESSIVLVMDYCGPANLHAFILQKLRHSSDATLPPELVERFVTHEAAGVAHLHAFMVCHRDLKPTNFIVSGDGRSLRLTDFGLAVTACGPEQKLMQCCGSLPFTAPEVLRLQHERQANSPGYNGFAADVWSLAVNFVELGHGLYTMERVLGWVPQPPAQPQQRRHDIDSFVEVWKTVPEMCVAGLKKVVDRMFVLRPEDRWAICRVVGPEGLGLEAVHECSVPGCLHNLKPRIHFASDEISIRQAPSDLTPHSPWRGSAAPPPRHPHQQADDAPVADELAWSFEGEDILDT